MKVGKKNTKKNRFFPVATDFFAIHLPTFIGELKGFSPGFKIAKNS